MRSIGIIVISLLVSILPNTVHSLDVDLPKIDVPDVHLPSDPSAHVESYGKVNAAHDSLSGAGKASLAKQSGGAEKASNYEKDRGFYYVKAYGWDREKKNERASGHAQSLKASKAGKLHKSKGHLNAKSHNSLNHESIATGNSIPEIPQVEYDQSGLHGDVYEPNPNAKYAEPIVHHSKPMHHNLMLGPHVPGHDYRYRVQHMPRHVTPRPSDQFDLNGHYRQSYTNNNHNPHLQELIRITKKSPSPIGGHLMNTGRPALGPSAYPLPHTSSYEGPAEVYYESYPNEADDDDAEEEGKAYYDRPISSFDLKRMREGHGKYNIPDDQLVQHFYPNRNRFESFRPPIHRYRLYRGSHYYWFFLFNYWIYLWAIVWWSFQQIRPLKHY